MAAKPNENRIMTRMLDRLFASILNGPSMNCRPHNSRQRIDWTQLTDLQDTAPTDALLEVLSSTAGAQLVGRAEAIEEESIATEGEQNKPIDARDQQNKLMRKLRLIAEEARTYQNDTGAYVLNIGFPILSIPPGAVGGGSRRVLAPLALIPVALSIKSGATPKVEIFCKEEGVDRVVPNDALIAWLEQQIGTKDGALPELDDEGNATWAEIATIARHVCTALEIAPPPWLTDVADVQSCSEEASKRENAPPSPTNGIQVCFPPPGSFTLQACPRADELPEAPTVLPCAVLGLFPNSNQGLIRDTRAMIAGEALSGPVEPFLSVAATMDDPSAKSAKSGDVIQQSPRFFTDERFVARADPCQARAVRAARDSKGLVVHGPPGTGKSQTITNVIGDHLARGERVLFVCDKRTALDVVANRLRAIGVGDLCAVVHDPQRDQLDLYRSLRAQLENLTRIDTNANAEKQLAKIDAELSKIYGDLRDTHKDLHAPVDGLPSFHELVGEWLALSDAAVADIDSATFADVTLAEIEPRTLDLRDLFARAAQVNFAGNIWTSAAGVALDAYMQRPASELRAAVANIVEAAREVDKTINPVAPPFGEAGDLQPQADARVALADKLEHLRKAIPLALRQKWLAADETARKAAYNKLINAADHFAVLDQSALDSDFAALTSDDDVSAADLARRMLALDEYITAAKKWFGFLLFGRKKAGKSIMQQIGVAPSRANAERLRAHLAGVRARRILTDLARDLTGGALPTDIVDDTRLREISHNLRDFFAALHAGESASLANVDKLVFEALGTHTSDARAAELVAALRSAAARAQAIAQFHQASAASQIIATEFDRELESVARRNEPIAQTAQRLSDDFESLEGVLRCRASHAKLPDGIRKAVGALLLAGVDTDTALAALRRGAAKREIDKRLRDNVRLPTLDAHRLETMIARFEELEGKKRDLVREAIFHQWVTKQKSRLLAGTETRLNSLGADMKRRLLLRGKNRLRLRQVIALGKSNIEGDPLFDLAPVWLASPETVAQIFAREPLFDIIMFDEASQVRLEEALPVLTRAKRVFIAGDPKQLPPTRFFESAVADSEAEEIETEQDLFEVQQSSVEDLLDAALNLDIPQSYLDVHYRSKDPGLIGFSNDYFYDDRLQPLPGHPARMPSTSPVSLIRVDGIYENRTNEREAQRVCELVRELLDQKKPPSIGIACFNVSQRDLIAERLDELALHDEKFAAKLADARSRSDEGEFRGLFVKNLENVQGDERDHIIISTTYGPDPKGRFYRRFGPLGMAGGGRRLNVLVTRAKERVHVVTSIPRSQYETLPPIPEGQNAAGGWLLFAYLQFADRLTDAFAAIEPAKNTATLFGAMPHGGDVKHPSRFAAALAQQLAANGGQAASPWGNDGFCIDVAYQRSGAQQAAHSGNGATNGNGAARSRLAADDVLGVLCDFNRYKGSDDPVDWEIYRTGIFNMLGWQCRRVWTPTFVRDAEGVVKTLVER